MKSRIIAINLGLCLIGASLPILFFTIYSELFLPQVDNPKISKKRQEALITEKVKAAENNYLPLYYPDQTFRHFTSSSFYPIGTLPYQKTYLCNEGYGLITYNSDRFGLRNVDNSWDKLAKEGGIFFLGDSFTNGACVKQESRFTDIFSRINNITAINLGVGGNDPYEYIASLRSVVQPVINSNHNNRYTVIISFYANDDVYFNKAKQQLLNKAKTSAIVTRDNRILPSKEYISALTENITDNYPTERRDVISTLKRVPIRISKHSSLHRIITMSHLRAKFYDLYKKIKNEGENPSIAALKELRSVCTEAFSCTPYVVYIPNSTKWRPDSSSIKYRELLRENTERLGIMFIDASDVILPENTLNYAPEGAHLSILGYQKLAHHLSKKIKLQN